MGEDEPAGRAAYYYRAENCGFRISIRSPKEAVFTVSVDDTLEKTAVPEEVSEMIPEPDLRPEVPEPVAGTEEDPAGQTAEEAEQRIIVYNVAYSAEEIAALEDGLHTVSVTSPGGAVMLPASFTEESRGAVFDGLAASFILDTVPPVIGGIVPDISPASYIPEGGRGRSGAPLFAGDVKLSVSASDVQKEDAGADTGSTGSDADTGEGTDTGAEVTGTSETGAGETGEDEVGETGKDPGIADIFCTVYTAGVCLEGDARHCAIGDPAQPPNSLPVARAEETVEAASYNNNDLLAVFTVYDRAGNAVSAEYAFGIDVSAPRVFVSYDNNDVRNGQYFAAGRTAYVSVYERNFDPSATGVDTEGEKGNWHYTPGESENGDDDRWIREVLFREDGAYHFSAYGRDLAGNPSQGTVYDGASPEAFVIDTAPPRVSVAYDNDDAENGMYFRNDRTCLITVEDPNFDGTHGIVVEADHAAAPAVAFADGAAAVSFTEDGRYRLSGTVTDLAGNTASLPEEAAFVVDKTFPRLTIQGVDDLSSNRTPLELILSAEDRNLVKEGIAAVLTGILSGETGPGGEAVLTEEGLIWALDPIETDDQYRLSVTVTDLAGNSVSRTISFSENRGGTRIEWEQKEAEGQVIGHAMRPSFVIRDIDPVTVLSVAVNGQEVLYDYKGDILTLREELSADGKYAIRIETVDAAGNICVLGPVEFKIRHPEEAGEEEAAQKERPETVRPDTVSPETVSPEEADPEDGPSAADSPQEPPAAAHAPDQGAAPGNAGSGEEGPGEAAPEDLPAENAPADKTQTEPAEREENSSFAIPCAAGIFFILLILWKRRKARTEEQVTDRARR
ncbi:MAG: hypothetical protein IJL72_00600 [Lachnospiraceae bacterium]|nr:hypothetical protein [Lachnospiraceae bacterium]